MYLFFNDAPLLGWLIDTNILILAIAIGVFLAFFAYWFTQTVIGSLVRALLTDSIGEDKAKTLDELKKNNFLFRFLLRDGSVLRRTVSCVGNELPLLEEDSKEAEKEAESTAEEKAEKVPEDAGDDNVARIIESKEEKKSFFARFKKPKKDYSKAKFFISEDNVEKATAKYPKKVSSLWLLLVLFLCISVGIAMTFLLPFIMGLILD
ncbi:MAG: hypothetical protein IKC74_03200 [Clostridia bacterium]|nr:hypothetical protein [Clostridia bacterium]